MDRLVDYSKINSRAKEQGQNLVELALLLPFMLIILMGVLDLGRIFFAQIAVTNAAREGVRYLTTHPADRISGFTKTAKAARDQAEFSGFPASSFAVAASCTYIDNDGSCEAGRALNQQDNTASVTVTYEFELISGWILPDSIALSHTASMVVP